MTLCFQRCLLTSSINICCTGITRSEFYTSGNVLVMISVSVLDDIDLLTSSSLVLYVYVQIIVTIDYLLFRFVVAAVASGEITVRHRQYSPYRNCHRRRFQLQELCRYQSTPSAHLLLSKLHRSHVSAINSNSQATRRAAIRTSRRTCIQPGPPGQLPTGAVAY